MFLDRHTTDEYGNPDEGCCASVALLLLFSFGVALILNRANFFGLLLDRRINQGGECTEVVRDLKCEFASGQEDQGV